MSGHLHDRRILARLAEALAAELPEVAPDRISAALTRAAAEVVPPSSTVVDQLAAGADPDGLIELIRDAERLFRDSAEWEQLVDLHVARVAASDDPAERAAILRQLADLFEHEMGEPERALAARLSAFGEEPCAEALADLDRLARETGRWSQLALRLGEVSGRELEPETAAAVTLRLAGICRDQIGDPAGALTALEQAAAAAPHRADIVRALADAYAEVGRAPDALDQLARAVDLETDDAARAELYREMATGWERLGLLDRAADCYEWVLSFATGDGAAYRELIRIYRETERWRALIDTLGRRATSLEPADRVPLFLEIAGIYEQNLGDEDGAIDFYQAADELLPGRPDVLAALARLYRSRDAHDDALATMERLVTLLPPGYRRAEALVAAADVAWSNLRDGDTARDLLIRARSADPDCVAAVDALARLHRDRGELAAAVELLEETAARPALVDHRGRLFAEAGALAIELDELDRATDLLFDARAARPGDADVSRMLGDLLWQQERHHELVPLLEQECDVCTDRDQLREQLYRLGVSSRAIGRAEQARDALARASDLDPDDRGARRALGELLFELCEWAQARQVLTEILDAEEDALPRADCVELHHKIGRAAHELGDSAAARLHIETALALDPAHRPSLVVHAELDADDPVALIADKLALANAAPPEERAGLLAAIADYYADELGDNLSAREIYREALVYRPTDHLLLTKCLGVTAEEGDWSRSLELVQQLIDSEVDPAIRAKYRHVAAMICRDELRDPAGAVARLSAALADAPAMVEAADELEALLTRMGRTEELARFYYLRLEQMREAEARPGEQLRLWDRLAEVSAALGHEGDAVCAYEVAIELEPTVARRQRLADLCVSAGVDRRDKAIEQHQAILADNKRRVASYEALQQLYRDTGQPEKAAACADALAVIGMRPVDGSRRIDTARPMSLPEDGPVLRGEDYALVCMGEVDRLLSALFARVAPAFAVDRARPRLSGRTALKDGDPRPAARAFRHVVARLAIDAPAAHVKREQAATALIGLRQGRDQLAPVLTVGRAALTSGADDRELVFELARTLIDLRSDRFARLLCPRAEELTQIVELALALGSDRAPASLGELGHTARWLSTALRPIDLDQVVTIGDRLVERGIDPARAALGWLEASERVADRVGYLLAGDLATCVRVLEREPAARASKHDRILDLVWASVTEPIFSVRARLESWADADSDAGESHGGVA